MPREKEKSSKAAVAVARGAGPASKIPTPLRFPLLYSFTAEYVAADLAGISGTLDQWEMGGLVAWRTYVIQTVPRYPKLSNRL
jgi:hypothetical protein